MTPIEERTIALAGIFQACKQVQTLARHGRVDEPVFDACLKSILVLDAVNTPAVYSGLSGVSLGLKMLSNGIMSSAKMEDVELFRYVMSILHLQSQLYADKKAFSVFTRDVERLSAMSDSDLVEGCSDLYRRYISNLRPQIIVQGEQNFLQRDEVPGKVRCMLFAAFRSAVLWRQIGGSKFKIFWERTRMRNAAIELLS
ncbi:MAG: lysogenization regulator HflD [Acidiferrobacterales bacterium]|nr:lysogenization regulator HflD [Acidiferrobacterales bacterium]